MLPEPDNEIVVVHISRPGGHQGQNVHDASHQTQHNQMAGCKRVSTAAQGALTVLIYTPHCQRHIYDDGSDVGLKHLM